MIADERKKIRIIVRGAGDLSSGIIHRLVSAGYPVMALETERPSAIRRQAAFSEAVYRGSAEVEGITAILAESVGQAEEILRQGKVPVLVDPEGAAIRTWKPDVLVDATISKINTGITRDMAPVTIALGPGFEAGKDADYVIETMRGHDLGRIFTSGCALPDTGLPGVIGGYGRERVIHAPAGGLFRSIRTIGDEVLKDEPVGYIETASGRVDVKTEISGILRGILPDAYPVTPGFKIADTDPRREEKKNCRTISDKARCIAGSVLELVCRYEAGR